MGAEPPTPYKKYNIGGEEMQVKKEIGILLFNVLKLVCKVLMLIGAVIGVVIIFKGVV